MQLSKLNDWMQVLASIGVLFGLLLVFVEVRQNNAIGRAEVIAGTYGMWQSISQIEMQTDINDLFIKSIEKPEELTTSEIMDLSSWLINVVSIHQRHSQLHDLGLSSDPVGSLRGSAQYYFGGRFARAWFEENQEWIRLTPVVYETIRDEIEATPVQTKFDYIDRVRSHY